VSAVAAAAVCNMLSSTGSYRWCRQQVLNIIPANLICSVLVTASVVVAVKSAPAV
jgi:hypothetical protein